MSSYRHVAKLTRKCGPGYVAHGPFKVMPFGAFYHHHGDAYSRDLKPPNQPASFGNRCYPGYRGSVLKLEFLIEKT